MTKLIICAAGRPNIHGHKRREFVWSPQYGCFVHGGKEYTPEEFNAVAEKAFSRNHDMHPYARVVSVGQATMAARVAELEAALAAEKASHADDAVPFTAQRGEIQLHEALEVVSRLAPSCLKKSARVPVGAVGKEDV